MIKGISKYSLLPVVILFLLMVGCKKDLIYTDSINIPSEEWSLDFIPEFKPVIDDTISICTFFLTIRTGTSYPYRNIWLFVNTISPSGKSITDTLQYMLAELDLPFRRTGIYFPEKGTYSIKVRHGMRNENLKGVYDLGLRISKIKK